MRLTSAQRAFMLAWFVALLLCFKDMLPRLALHFSHSKPMPFDILTATVSDLRLLLEQRKVTTVELVEAYLRQIRKHNKDGARLNAIISVVPEKQLLATASKLDQERADGKIRSLCHGIPFVIKDNMWTASSFALPTTCGAYALKDAMARENADIVQALLDAGMLLLGKANLSEMAGMKGSGGFAGWSTVGGQTQSPYVVNGVDPTDSWLGHSTPAGSSSGSAVAVAAGMAPVALGTETDGSVLQPSDRASLYSLKLTVGKASTRGTLPGTPVSDALGPMTKSSEDVAALLDIMTPIKGKTHRDFLTKSFAGLRIGFLNPNQWASGPGAVRPSVDFTQQVSDEVAKAIDVIEKAGAQVKRDISLRRFSGEDDKMFNDILSVDYVKGFAEFVDGLDHASVRTMQDLVIFNNEHASICLPPGSPDQQTLENAVRTHITEETYHEYLATLRRHNKDEGIDAALREYDVDIIMGPTTGRSATIAALAGYPVGTVPLGYARFNGRPFGLAVIATANAESLILTVMSAWEATFERRQPPPKIVNWDRGASEKEASHQ